MIKAKICGIRTVESLRACCENGAHMVGFVFYSASPRYVTPQMAAALARQVPTSVRTVGLFVNPSDEWLDEVLGQVPLDLIQLHGHETPERVAEIAEVWSIPIIKAIAVATEEDLKDYNAYRPHVAWILLDAKPPENVAALPGGNGLSFDWRLLQNKKLAGAWMLSGGLNAENINEAIAQTNASAVDISSGVEIRIGQKCPEKIKLFLEQLKEE